MTPVKKGNFNYLLFHYTKSKARIWEGYLCNTHSITAYHDKLENYTSFFAEFISSLAHAQRSCNLTEHQKLAYDNMIRQLFEESKLIKACTLNYLQSLKGKPLSAKERKWQQEMLEYCDDLPDEPDMISKRYFTNNGIRQEITFKSSFSVDDGENIHTYPPTAIIYSTDNQKS